MAHIETWASVGYVGATRRDTQPLPDDWADMSEEERSAFLDEAANEYLHEYVDYGAKVVE